MHQGHCLCGLVRYELDVDPASVFICHCSQCRRASGTAFAVNVAVTTEQFRLTAGETELKEYESSPGKHRVFCGNCGTPLYSKTEKLPGVLRLRTGSLDADLASVPKQHIFAAHKLSWIPLFGEYPVHVESPPRGPGGGPPR